MHVPLFRYKVDPRFSFVKEGEHMNYTDLKYWMDRMIYKTEWDRQHPLVRALFRGIGVHHAGMPSTYKDLVETLFRGKHIKIVVATNTLAMGINMPCRTAMFAGNDKLITPLLFRQMQVHTSPLVSPDFSSA
jgi:replicative superfamily II helicase